jgi:murein DD-endopeptidase MepM/ murein hydrolase activator NlpD
VCDACAATTSDGPDRPTLSRRTFVRAGLAATAISLVPSVASAKGRPDRGSTDLINPYSGSIPLTFPLAAGTYQTPLGDNWHAGREGQLYQWSHRDGKFQRAHDGADVYPVSDTALPTVYAPLTGKIAAVCVRSDNTLDASVSYRVSASTPPPWNYSQGVDNVANLPLYGNFVWIYSTSGPSAGYFVFYCHLQNDALISALAPDQPVTTATAVGTMGDTGNAEGTPQLHVEIHYPSGRSFTCTRCSPKKSGVTAIDPFASLVNSTAR